MEEISPEDEKEKQEFITSSEIREIYNMEKSETFFGKVPTE